LLLLVFGAAAAFTPLIFSASMSRSCKLKHFFSLFAYFILVVVVADPLFTVVIILSCPLRCLFLRLDSLFALLMTIVSSFRIKFNLS